MSANPYQLSSIRTNLDSLRNIQGMDRQQTLVDTLMQKQKISEDYEKDVEAIQKDARDRSKKHSGVLKGIKGIATLFGGPLANAIVGGITSGVQLKQQKSGAKMLQNKAMDRYSRNFMSQQADTFKEQADKAKVSEMPIGIEEFAKDFKPEGLLDKAEYGKIYFGDEGFKPSMLDIDENILDSKMPGIKNLIETITKGGDIGKLSEELEGALKIPTLLQLLLQGRQ